VPRVERFCALVACEGERIVVEGGTHNPLAPPSNSSRARSVPLVARMGAKVSSARPGFYPLAVARRRA
jgi:RNA 3'-terminal phosphate cyclase (ATP)